MRIESWLSLIKQYFVAIRHCVQQIGTAVIGNKRNILTYLAPHVLNIISVLFRLLLCLDYHRCKRLEHSLCPLRIQESKRKYSDHELVQPKQLRLLTKFQNVIFQILLLLKFISQPHLDKVSCNGSPSVEELSLFDWPSLVTKKLQWFIARFGGCAMGVVKKVLVLISIVVLKLSCVLVRLLQVCTIY